MLLLLSLPHGSLVVEPGVLLEQICVLDHSGHGYRPRHLHIQCHFTDSSSSVWLNIDGTLPQLRDALRALQPSPRVRLHMHADDEEEAPNGGAASARAIGALPRLKLEPQSVSRLAADDVDSCPFCLEVFAEDDEILCMPCPVSK